MIMQLTALGCWRADYNDARPHSQLGWKTPSEFAFTCHPRRDLALRYAEGSAPAPVATTAQQGNPLEDVSKPADCHRCLDSTGPKAHQIARPRL
jgi:hypothetical protein